MKQILYVYFLSFILLHGQFLLANNEKSRATQVIESGDIDKIMKFINKINWKNHPKRRISFYAGLLQKQIAKQKIDENQLKSKLTLQQKYYLFDKYELFEVSEDDSGYMADESDSQTEDTNLVSSQDFDEIPQEEWSVCTDDQPVQTQINAFLSLFQKHPVKIIAGACSLSSAITLLGNHMVRVVRKRMKEKQREQQKQNESVKK